MDENEISYLPLKGIILQDIYPKLGMRQMVDNDILIDINKRDLVREYMENNGYKVDLYDRDIYDVYMKPPIFNFGMHVYLTTESVDALIYNYYSDIRQRLERPDENRCQYSFSKADFYIHILVHAYKHFYHTGSIGLKTLADIFVYLNRYNKELDRKYPKSELNKINLTVFEKNITALSKKIFDADNVKITDKLGRKKHRCFDSLSTRTALVTNLYCSAVWWNVLPTATVKSPEEAKLNIYSTGFSRPRQILCKSE